MSNRTADTPTAFSMKSFPATSWSFTNRLTHNWQEGLQQVFFTCLLKCWSRSSVLSRIWNVLWLVLFSDVECLRSVEFTCCITTNAAEVFWNRPRLCIFNNLTMHRSQTLVGCVMVQGVSGRSFNAESRAQLHANPCGICGERSAIWFYPFTSVSSCQYNFISVPYYFVYHWHYIMSAADSVEITHTDWLTDWL